MTNISIRLPEELVEAINHLANKTDRSKTFIIKKAIVAYMEEQADYQIALDRLNDKDDGILSSAEFKKILG